MSNLKKFMSGEQIPDGIKETVIFESNTEPPKNYIWAKPDGKLYVHDADWEEIEMSGSIKDYSKFAEFLQEIEQLQIEVMPDFWKIGDSPEIYSYSELMEAFNEGFDGKNLIALYTNIPQFPNTSNHEMFMGIDESGNFNYNDNNHVNFKSVILNEKTYYILEQGSF